MLKDLLLDMIDILFPLLLYQFICITNKSFYERERHRQILLGILCGTAIVLSMLLPEVITNDFNGDLRSIPLIISVVYGGYMGGIVSFSFFFLCRFFIDVDGFWLSAAASFLICAAAYMCAARFYSRTPRFRFSLCLIAALAAWGVLWGASVIAASTEEIHSAALAVQIGLLQLAAMCMSVVLMEVTIKAFSMQDQLIRTEKLNVTSQLAAAVAHEIRSPLTAVKGFLQLLLRNVEGKERQYVEISMTELNRMEYIVDDFLNYSKPQTETIEVCSVREILKQMKETADPLARSKSIDIQVDAEQALWIEANPFKIKQALIHIIKNAIDASMAPGGHISVKACRRSNQVCIDIQDYGTGMTPEQLEILGTPFYSTKTNGTGLGLMAAFRIVHAIHGKLEFRSVKGEGTTATMTVPAAKAISLEKNGGNSKLSSG
ncbi:HAMP domain-containing sensor histidine kinase [Paenibacillus hodogayensis]|uniref:histidine kinase n=1 Tax=Paenibacillus hodogayensis TaxID=279208 RepID=A0ABV5W3U3_9BACL